MLRSLSCCSALMLMTGFAVLSAPAGAITFNDGMQSQETTYEVIGGSHV
jgi:hypothetical protein